jgi:DNA-binding PadR family transcriptional regulator
MNSKARSASGITLDDYKRSIILYRLITAAGEGGVWGSEFQAFIANIGGTFVSAYHVEKGMNELVALGWVSVGFTENKRGAFRRYYAITTAGAFALYSMIHALPESVRNDAAIVAARKVKEIVARLTDEGEV